LSVSREGENQLRGLDVAVRIFAMLSMTRRVASAIIVDRGAGRGGVMPPNQQAIPEHSTVEVLKPDPPGDRLD
jgi:hypothetical protein